MKHLLPPPRAESDPQRVCYAATHKVTLPLGQYTSAVGLKVDFDLALLVIASGLYRRLANRMRGYADAQARQIFRDLVDMPATVRVTPTEVRVTLHRRAHLPILMASNILAESPSVPWWNGARLILQPNPGC